MILTRLSRYLLREVALAWLAVTVVLVVVLLTNRLVRFLSEAASGEVPPGVIFHLLALKALGNLATVLPASFFLGVMLALGRLYRDSEMAAMNACGVGPRHLYRALYLLAAPLALLVGFNALTLGPWAERRAEQALLEAQQETQFHGVRPGQFIRLGDSDSVVYVESVAEDGTMRGVFARRGQPEARENVVVAESARRRLEPQSGDDFLVLSDGHRYDGEPGKRSWRLIDFAEHGIRIGVPSRQDFSAGRDTQPWRELWRSERVSWRAELQWRLSMPIATLLLTLLAVPLAKSQPRAGRYAKLVGAVLIYMAYFNALKAAQDWVAAGRLPEALGLWVVHGVVAALGVLALAWRYRVFQWEGR